MVPEDIEHITKPIIGYIGAIGDVFDKKLILELANTLPHINILIVGPVHTDISKLENIKNIIFIGERRHDLMSNYINSFDVALIPYIVNDATDRVYSCKLNEYLSMGKLVVSTNMYEIRIFNKQNDNVVSVGKDVKDFIDKVKKLFEKPIVESKEDYRKRVNIAKENTWDRRFAGISEAIESCLELKTESIPPWKERLKKSYRLKHRSFLKFIVYLFSLYLLIFYSPLLWYVGNQLVVRDALQQSDAIVVFSGDGEVNYRNSSYQRRALDAVRLYKSGFAADIFISSGRRQTISDVEMIRLFLINKGVPESSIHILEKYPSSTYQGVEMVSQMLYDNNINSILFLTSPYHSRRAVLTWKKNVPSIQIVAPEVIDSPSGDVQWGVEFDAMRVIGYEYTAIVHNWLDGRI
jgi:uncharacterized SAM-binding protein YcdF (DUF218 family)